MTSRISLKQIAQEAGTSVSTVSRVLSSKEHRCNTEGLAERIWEIAQREGYVPDVAAQALRQAGTDQSQEQAPFTVDIFLSRFDSIETDPFFAELFQSIREELLHNRCALGEVLGKADVSSLTSGKGLAGKVPYRSQRVMKAEAVSNKASLVQSKDNAGLVVLGKVSKELASILKSRYTNIVGIDRNPTDFIYDEIVCDGTAAAVTAMEYLLELGHRKIAYVGDCDYESRYTGYYQALISHHIPLEYGNIYPTDQSMAQGEEAMGKILDKEERPTAIFCANDVTALGVLKRLRSSRKRGYVPSVISIDNIREAEKARPMLTTVDIPQSEMAHLAIMLLLDRRDNGHEKAVHIELPCRLVVRDSCTYCV